ncbi:Uncharacterised protein [Corynebacterium kutscheri]|uniref:DUF4192 family protein n=1 Tax=Corynebacterium kutscheri TaxID=35755 RepID=A0A0F6QZX2_9CORY|nr:DUF4192 domain-containing protein [Corynebacterium kutscheri]AKE41382.1 protein of unknown function (DUF4192) [Corynebacterium kutscheri]VEH08659.1 Uncharacterised protein [Corynebacterium kutscheri]VEH09706.1 Uncharacterised protein [Corynebacterium kutscheri]VEH79788.1 Uncharacterised protein [Corynebacterium kutscheri]
MNTLLILKPGDFLAQLPGILGYYPIESLVLVGLAKPLSNCSVMGPILRIDIAQLAYPDIFRDCLTVVGNDNYVYFGFFISDDKDEIFIDQYIRYLFQYASADAFPLAALWSVVGITEGSEYELRFLSEDAFGYFGQSTPQNPWYSGLVGSIAHAQSTLELTQRGYNIELSAEHVACFFAPDIDDPYSEKLRTIITEQAHRDAENILLRSQKSALSDMKNLYQTIQDYLCTTEPNPPGMIHIQALATLLAQTRLRDSIIDLLYAHPQTSRQLLHATALKTRSIIRSNALALYAAVAINEGVTARVHKALKAAHEETPQHALTRLIGLAYATENGKEIIAQLIEVSRNERENLLFELDSRSTHKGGNPGHAA